jgi:hypothetical protein
MPPEPVQADEDVIAQRRSGHWEVARMRRIAKRFRVTPTAVATRMLRMRVMTAAAYSRWKVDWEA